MPLQVWVMYSHQFAASCGLHKPCVVAFMYCSLYASFPQKLLIRCRVRYHQLHYID